MFIRILYSNINSKIIWIILQIIVFAKFYAGVFIQLHSIMRVTDKVRKVRVYKQSRFCPGNVSILRHIATLSLHYLYIAVALSSKIRRNSWIANLPAVIWAKSPLATIRWTMSVATISLRSLLGLKWAWNGLCA